MVILGISNFSALQTLLTIYYYLKGNIIVKLSFSTLGCPDWDLITVISKAAEYGFDGIEIRGILQELDVTKLRTFTTDAKDTRLRLEDAGIELICFSSSVNHLLLGLQM